MIDADGKWIGWGLGDSDPKVAGFKDKLRGRFSYAADLDHSEVYDEALAQVVAEAQRRWGFPATGVIDYKFQVKAGWIKPPAPAKPMLYTVHGTGQADPMGPGLPADTARAVAHQYEWQPIGNYPAKPFPMWPSIQQGLDELNFQAGRGDRSQRDIALAGYSQGAIVVSLFLKYSVGLGGRRGPLYHLRDRIKKVVLWGNPMRQPGIVAEDRWLPSAPRTLDNGGILEYDRLEGLETEPYAVADFAHLDDMYATNWHDTKEGENQTAICKIIMGNNVFGGQDNILEQLFELVRPGNTLKEIYGVYRAMIDAGTFFGRGTAAHGYDIGPAIHWLTH